jgi:hypothetical protein
MARMLGKVATKGCIYGCCTLYGNDKRGRKMAVKAGRRRERQSFRKALASGADL